MTDRLLALPLMLPLLAAGLALLCWRWRGLQRALAVLGSGGQLLAAAALLAAVRRHGILHSDAGGWPAPFGITLVADTFSALMLVVTSLIGLVVVVYSLGSIDRERESFGYYPLVLTLLLGVGGALLTGDLFNLYVWFEVLLICSFVLLALGGERRQMEGAIRYFVLNMLSSVFFLAALGILYGMAHSLNLADLAQRVSGADDPRALTVAAVLFLFAFSLKAALFPLFFWLPSSYPAPPVAVSALFAGLLTKVGVYSLIRVFTLVFADDRIFTHTLLLWLAGLSMIVGVLGALAQSEIRRILSFHIVSQIGYMVLGLALFTPLALAGAVFYLLHHMVVKTSLFLVGGLVIQTRATGRLSELGGMLRSAPGLALLFALAALSLAGLPPSSGFWAKLLLVRASLEADSYAIAVCALAASLLTLLSMSKIWNEVFWAPHPTATGDAGSARRPGWLMMASTAALVAASVGIAVAAGPIFALAEQAARELLDRPGYVAAVLGEAP